MYDNGRVYMKNQKKLINLILVLFLFLSSVIIVKAESLPKTLTKITQEGTSLFDSSCGAEDNDGDGTVDCYGMAVKWSESTGANICTKYNKPSPASGGVSCTITDDWSKSIRYSVAKIIKASSLSSNLKQANASY